MRIQHNIMAMNAYRNYNTNTSALSKNLEKLSSGYKINRAGDDAAGLAISEKMRAQITGLNAAQKNVKDGVSLVKTAEGAMQEIQDMLNRMDYLATQSANGTYDNEVDRANLQKEVDALKTEINRIADSANFNGIKLLDGSLDSKADMSTKVDFAVGDTLPKVGQTLGVDTVLHNEALSDNGTEFDVDLHNFTFDAATGDTMTLKVGDTTFELTANTAVSGGLSGSTLADAILGKNGSVDVVVKDKDGNELASSISGSTAAITGFKINGQDFTIDNSDRESSAIRFTQTNAPTSKDDEVNGAMKVTLTGVKAGTKAQYSLDFAGTNALGAAGTAAAGDTFTFGGVTVTATGGETAGQIAALFTGASAGFTNYDVAVSGGKVTLTAKTTGVGTAAPTASMNIAATTVTKAGTDAVSGKEAVEAVYQSGTFTALTANGDIEFAGHTYAHTYNAADTAGSQLQDFADDWNANSTAKDIWTVSVSGDTLLFTAATAGKIDAGNAATGAPIAAPTGITTVATTGADAIQQVYEFDLSGWDGTSDVTLGGTAVSADDIMDGSAFGQTGGDNDYSVDFDADTGKLTVTAVTAGAPGTTGPTAITDDIDFTKAAENKTLTVSTDDAGSSDADIDGITQGAKGDWNVSTTNINNVTSDGIDRLASTYFELTEEMATEGSSIKVGDSTYTFTADKDLIGTAGYVDISSGDIKQIAKNLTEAASGNTLYTVGNDGSRMTFTETKAHFDAHQGGDDQGWDLSKVENIEKSLGFTAGASSTKSGKALTLQIGDTSDKFNQMEVSVGDMHTKAMGTEGGKSIADIDISTQAGASEAVSVIKDAINYVSGVRGDLGAIQNRLEHTQNNLSVMAENIQDAESTIRDTDVAEEMMSYVKNNILVQSAQAMLAQANQVPQGVLQLLG